MNLGGLGSEAWGQQAIPQPPQEGVWQVRNRCTSQEKGAQQERLLVNSL